MNFNGITLKNKNELHLSEMIFKQTNKYCSSNTENILLTKEKVNER